MKIEPLYIVAGARTPFARMGTDLASLDATDLGTAASKALIARSGIDPTRIDESIFGCVAQPADAANIARVIALRSGVPQHRPAATVHRNCGSGFEAITTAAERAASGRGSLFLVGGTESMTQAPFHYRKSAQRKFALLARARSARERLRASAAFRRKDFVPVPSLRLGLTDPFCGLNMGQTAERLAEVFGISRDEQDAFAAASHQKAAASRSNTDAGIITVFPGDTNRQVVSRDNGIREGSNAAALSRLKPVFDRKHGTVTAGNASQITDGAVALLVATEKRLAELNLPPLGRLTGYAYTGCRPDWMGLGPVNAIAAVNHSTGLALNDADTVEINEAFAAQVLAVRKALADPEAARTAGIDAPEGVIPDEKLNPSGGAIALGHPVGATGARLVLDALHHLHRTGGKRALVSLCIGGGQGGALWLEKP